MLNDYKGEKPNNVITEEEHKKRPFYKKVSFWVLSVLGLFFGGCSVYGLVLGYQYVHAVTEAAHIIAEANESSEAETPKPFIRSLVVPNGYQETFTFNCTINEPSTNGFHSFALIDGTEISGNVAYPYLTGNYTQGSGYYLSLYIYNRIISVGDYIHNAQTTNCELYPNDSNGFGTILHSSRFSWPMNISGTFMFKPYDAGYLQGESEGYHDGYQEGYDDGSGAINLPQSVKVLLPVGNEYSVQYKSYVDGVVDRQGQLNSSQTGGAYATFDRSRTQKLRIDLTLPTGSRAFFLYTPSWTSAYPTDENYSLRQSWAVSGVTYLPTWVSKPQIYVGVTSADVPDLTYETVSVAFDVDHWGDIKVGAYSQGYNDGYQAGEENPTAYDSGYDAGYEQGYEDGHTLGVAQGESQAVSGQKALVNMFVTAFQQPFDQIYRFLNFNVLGLNILALFTALLTLSIGIIIIKKVI